MRQGLLAGQRHPHSHSHAVPKNGAAGAGGVDKGGQPVSPYTRFHDDEWMVGAKVGACGSADASVCGMQWLARREVPARARRVGTPCLFGMCAAFNDGCVRVLCHAPPRAAPLYLMHLGI